MPKRAESTPSPIKAGGSEVMSPKARRTRAALLLAAREQFERLGYADTKIAAIADAAQVAHGTVYTYFKSKEEIFDEVVSAMVGDLIVSTHVSGSGAATPKERIEAANRAYLHAYARNAQLMARLDQVAISSPTFQRVRRDIRRGFVNRAAHAIRRWQAEGSADQNLDADVAASALGGMVEHFAHVWLFLGEDFEEEVVVANLTRLWAQAIGLSLDD